MSIRNVQQRLPLRRALSVTVLATLLGASVTSATAAAIPTSPLARKWRERPHNVCYRDGEFAIQETAADSDAIYVAGVPGIYSDTSLAVDIHATSNDYGSVEHVWCRRSADGSYGWTLSPAIKLGTASNHVELICRGSVIELYVNGTRIVSVRNADRSEGRIGLGVGGFDNADALAEVRFANLVITQR